MTKNKKVLSYCKIGIFALILANEVRGLILAGPVLVALFQAGGKWMTVLLILATLVGIALSVCLPALALKKLQHDTPNLLEGGPKKRFAGGFSVIATVMSKDRSAETADYS